MTELSPAVEKLIEERARLIRALDAIIEAGRMSPDERPRYMADIARAALKDLGVATQ